MQHLFHDHSVWHALLDFQFEAGVDCALEEEPQDRFAIQQEVAAELSAATNAAQQNTPRAVAAFQTQPAMPRHLQADAAKAPDEVALMARDLARNAQSLDELHHLLSEFDGCTLKTSAKNLVFSDGSPTAKIMLIGEAPGAEEDRIGKPFVGRSGQLLDRMLHAIGMDRSSVYIANIVPWRPPGNRTPTPQEVAICRPFIERQIELVNPDLLVTLGGPSTQNLLNVKEGILRSRGRWFPYALPNRSIQALATLHPAYLLRQPLQKRLAWRDFQALRQAFDKSATREQT
ncbi:uracil-DNA glycosylase [Microvirga sp. W0021]|uniref:Type-4 uracil-DNA glycosylase n=1 Tax=Hohaiivirga grylli TaxID=3133970 RepID=A0ABV0BHD9_9HYPH